MRSSIFSRSSHSLSESDRRLIGACLRAAVEGPFFPDWEFEVLFGFRRDEVRAVLDAWPASEPIDRTTRAVVCATLNQLLGYPHGLETELRKRTGADQAQLQELSERLR